MPMSLSEQAKNYYGERQHSENSASYLLPHYSIAEAQRYFGIENVSMSYLYVSYNLQDIGSPEAELIDYHQRDHFGRMLVNSVPFLLTLRKSGVKLPKHAIEIVQWFTVIHDAFLREDNYLEHGNEAAMYVRDENISLVPEHLRKDLATAIEQHVPHDTPKLPLITKLCKEIDLLDRVRLPAHERLNPDFIRFKQTKILIPLAEAVHDLSVQYIRQGEDPFFAALLAGRNLGILSD